MRPYTASLPRNASTSAVSARLSAARIATCSKRLRLGMRRSFHAPSSQWLRTGFHTRSRSDAPRSSCTCAMNALIGAWLAAAAEIGASSGAADSLTDRVCTLVPSALVPASVVSTMKTRCPSCSYSRTTSSPSMLGRSSIAPLSPSCTTSSPSSRSAVRRATDSCVIAYHTRSANTMLGLAL